MGLTKHLLGEYIILLDNRNKDLRYGVEDVRGINNLKKMIKTKADTSGRKLNNFYVVYPENFVFNHRTSRNGDKFSITYNYDDRPYIFTEDYVVFGIKETCRDLLLPEWLYMFFCRSEFDRYVITNSWGSSTEFYNWEDICNVELVIPSIELQKKYVDIYNAMIANQQSYERGLQDLKLTIDVMLDKLKYTEQKISIGRLLEEVDIRNEKGTFTEVAGINITKQFMPSVASSSDLKKYKIVNENQFAYSSMQTGRDRCIRIALLQDDTPIIVSPAYSVLKKKTDNVLEEYIQMWFSREESDRLGWFFSDASIRTNLDLERFYEIQIPVPDVQKQKALVDIYNVYVIRRDINEKLKNKIKDICPILIKGSLQ